ncbi:MAG: alpha-L-fucosidase [Planctomycetaceae bacterium]|nr:alpha-L-fucosidase [Planctomycetaceae bacterium]
MAKMILILLLGCCFVQSVSATGSDWAVLPKSANTISEKAEPMQTGRFDANWQSLGQYQTPEWYRDAKFGIWAHWGPQCQPERGDWYARNMYMQGHRQYKSHLDNYGHPSVFGFKDVINEWKAENWDPDKLVAFYRQVGAQYFVALANHHDNLDNWDSTYQSWNSVAIGPRKNIIAGWAAAARKQDLPFGVSVHASHAWMWYEPAQGSDKSGEYSGIAYDGKLTRAEGICQWWQGLDPQELYAQDHIPSTVNETGKLWGWDASQGCSIPDAAYCEKFYNRTIELLNKYKPDLIYFDDTILPLYPVSDAGLKIAAHFYNSSPLWNNGQFRAVMSNKILSREQRRCMIWDIEKGASNQIEPQPWQTCTCLGSWHYDRGIYERKGYKSAKTVVHMLVDIVSKNGNLLLSVPLRGDGTFDDQEESILRKLGAWMAANGEAIFATRPWKVFGEGPAMKDAAPLRAQGFNEGKGKPLTAEDVRYTMSKDGKTLYAVVMGRPSGNTLLKSVHVTEASPEAKVHLLSQAANVPYTVDGSGRLQMTWPESSQAYEYDDYACVFKLTGFELTYQPETSEQ